MRMFIQFWISRPFVLFVVGIILQSKMVDVHTLPVGSQPLTDHDSVFISRIDAFVKSLQRCAQFPGLTMAAVKTRNRNAYEDPMLLVRHYGVLDVVTKRPVQDGTRFCIGSVTKSFTAALLTQLLHDNSTYSLDTPIHRILDPGFKLHDAERTEKTSLRDLLAHKVGVAKYFGAFQMGYNFTRPDIVRRVRYLPPLQPFRSSFVYNNFMYVVAGQIAEKLNGTWWENQILWRFLKKLHMDKTVFADRVPDWTNDFALPHVLSDGRLVPLRAKVTGNILRPVGPAGSICSTASDMAHWLLLHLNNGTNQHGEAVISPAVLNELFKPQNPYINKGNLTSLRNGYGLGWVIDNYRGKTRIWHDGFANYYGALVSLLPDEGIAIFTALNGPDLFTGENAMRAIHFNIIDLLVGEKLRLGSSKVCDFISRKPKSAKTTKPAVASTSRPTTPLTKKLSSTVKVAFSAEMQQTTDISDNSDATNLNFGDSTTETNFKSAMGHADDSNYDTSTEFIDPDPKTINNVETIPESSRLIPSGAPSIVQAGDNPTGTKPDNSIVVLSGPPAVREDLNYSSHMPTVNTTLRPLRRLKIRKRPNKLQSSSLTTTSGTVFTETHYDNVTHSQFVTSAEHNETTNSDRFFIKTGHDRESAVKSGYVTSTQNALTENSIINSDDEQIFTVSPLLQGEFSVQSGNSFGSRLRNVRRRPVRIRRPKRSPAIYSVLKPFLGTYANPFFGDVIINMNRTVPALQFNYGYYGRALLEPISMEPNRPIVFKMHFFNSIWYQSEGDDNKLLAPLGVFNVQFGSSTKNGIVDRLVVFLFDLEKPPIFSRQI